MAMIDERASMTHASAQVCASIRIAQMLLQTCASRGCVCERKHAVQSMLVSPEFGEAWQTFAGKVGTHGKEMQRIADSIYYPKVHSLLPQGNLSCSLTCLKFPC